MVRDVLLYADSNIDHHVCMVLQVTSRNMEAVIRLDIDVDTCKSSDFSNKENVNASKGRKESDASKEDCSLERGLPFSAGDRTLVCLCQLLCTPRLLYTWCCRSNVASRSDCSSLS